MARPSQDAIETFMSITGVAEAAAVQKLEQFNGDLNEAVNAHFSEGDRSISGTAYAPVPCNDFMDIDDSSDADTVAPTPSLLFGNRRLNPFSILDPHFGQSLFDGGIADFLARVPRVSHPRDVRQIPIEFKDENPSQGTSTQGPRIEDVTGRASGHGPEVHGTVVIEEEEQDDDVVPSFPADHAVSIMPSNDYTNDIEEEMIQAAIEASKREVENLASPEVDRDSPILEDSDLAHVVSLSLKSERAARGQGTLAMEQSSNSSGSRQWLVGPKSQISSQLDSLERDPSFDEEAEDVDEEPLLRHRSRNAASETAQHVIGDPQRPENGHPTQCNCDVFQLDEWGGISSQEHDEAVMLEAAMYGGIPERSAYRIPYPRHQDAFGDLDRAPYPASPRLVEQRMLREQQDDEYLASLQADREKELNAIREAEERRLEDVAARESALERKKHHEEVAQNKKLEEEEFERKLAAKQSSLPQEPTVGDENSVTLLIRMPDGSRCGRSFLKSDTLQLIYDYIDVGRLVKHGTYRLVRPYPRHAFTDEESQLTLSDLGLTSKQEALFLELI